MAYGVYAFRHLYFHFQFISFEQLENIWKFE